MSGVQRAVPWTALDVLKGLVSALVLSAIFLGTGVWLARSLGGQGIFGGVVPLPFILVLISELVLAGAAWLFTARKYRCGWRPLGLAPLRRRRHLLWVPAVLVVALIVEIAYGALIVSLGLEKLLPEQPVLPLFGSGLRALILAAVVAVLAAPIAEELFFRGFVFAGLSAYVGGGWGAVASAAIFTVAHLQIGVAAPIFVLGLLLAWLYLRSGSLWPSIAVHGAFNLVSLLAAYFAQPQGGLSL